MFPRRASWFWKGCKPIFVCVLADGENHLSQQPVPETRFACANTGAGRPKWFPIWPCTRWGFPCRVACASRGALLPHLFTLTPGLRRWRFNFLWHFPWKSFPTFPPRVSPAKPELRGIAPGGVRTFLPRLAPEAILRPSKTSGTIEEAGKHNKRRTKLLLHASYDLPREDAVKRKKAFVLHRACQLRADASGRAGCLIA